jgi:hypothetical protein
MDSEGISTSKSLYREPPRGLFCGDWRNLRIEAAGKRAEDEVSRT